MSAEQARKKFGASNFTALTSQVQDALGKAEEIQHTVCKLARMEEKCFLEKLGIVESDSSEDSESDNEREDDESTFMCISSSDEEMDEDNDLNCCQMGNTAPAEDHLKDQSQTCTPEHVPARVDKGPQVHPHDIIKNQAIVSPVASFDHLLCMLRDVKLNWFAFDVLNQALRDFAHHLPFTDISLEEERLIEQSRQAFLMKEREKVSEGDIVSESESDDPELYAEISSGDNLRDPKVTELVTHKKGY